MKGLKFISGGKSREHLRSWFGICLLVIVYVCEREWDCNCVCVSFCFSLPPVSSVFKGQRGFMRPHYESSDTCFYHSKSLIGKSNVRFPLIRGGMRTVSDKIIRCFFNYGNFWPCGLNDGNDDDGNYIFGIKWPTPLTCFLISLAYYVS